MRESAAGQPVPFVRRVRVKNYRSIADCDVTLGPLTILLGDNAAGKTNFLDALQFVAEALEFSPQQASDRRGGLEVLLHRSPDGTADSFEIWLDLAMRLPGVAEDLALTYGFVIGPDPAGEAPLLVRREAGEIQIPGGTLPLPLDATGTSARLRLPAASVEADAPQAVLESALRSTRFYRLRTSTLRAVDDQPDRRPYLGPAGEHLGHVLRELAQDTTVKERFDTQLAALVPGALGVDERREGRYSTVQGRFRAGDGTGVAVFLRDELSDGTLRAAGVLAALCQPPVSAGRVPLVAIEQPDTALHPARLGALYPALADAATRTQVIVTSQSADLLDSETAQLDHVRVVTNVDGATLVGAVDDEGHAVEKGRLTLSELHRGGRLRPVGADRARRMP